MLDNKWLEALACVISEGGFERAAHKLHLSQSAVSQRIRNLEEHFGRILVNRTTPPEPTEAGRVLIRHLKHVRLLEHELAVELETDKDNTFITLPVGVNADSLATWFLEALDDFLRREHVLLDLYVDDETRTHELLLRGEVLGCVGTRRQPRAGFRSDFLNTGCYMCICTPDYRDTWFARGMDLESMTRAPAVVFNRKDTAQSRMLDTLFPGRTVEHPTMYVPSSHSFLDVVKRGLVYGMVPDIQAREAIAEGVCVELLPEARVDVTLYWQSWHMQTPLLTRLRESLVTFFRKDEEA